MNKQLLKWAIYEVTAQNTPINGVMLRGRIRKLGIEKGFNVIAENTEDKENGVRFAVLKTEDGQTVSDYIMTIIADANVALLETDISNPVLSKLKVNDQSRYAL